jgi:hypothetical protein
LGIEHFAGNVIMGFARFGMVRFFLRIGKLDIKKEELVIGRTGGFSPGH